MGVLVANNVAGFLGEPISTSATTIQLRTGDGARFPAVGAGQYFYLTLIAPNNVFEIVKVTARVDDVLTVVRAQEGTVAAAFVAGSKAELRVTAQAVKDLFGDAVESIGLITSDIDDIREVADNLDEINQILDVLDTSVAGGKQLFVAGTDYTINVSTQLTLAQTPVVNGTVSVYFAGVYKNSNTYTYNFSTGVFTFTSPINAANVEIVYDIGRSFEELDAAVAAVDADRIATAASATSASGSASTATTQAEIATTQATTATTQATNAASSATAAAGSAATATTQAGVATTQATNAAGSAATATTQAGIATTQAGIATTQAGIATAQATNATSAAITAVNAPGTTATSVTTNSVNLTSPKTFDIQPGKFLIAGMFLLVASTASPATYMIVQVVSYNPTSGSLQVNVVDAEGSGTFSDWSLSLSPPPGGASSGGFPVGAFAYWDADGTIPPGHLAFTTTQYLPRGTYPLLDTVIPAAPDEFGRTAGVLIENPEPTTSDAFGSAIAVSGNYAVVCSSLDDPGGVTNAGSVYIYFFNGSSWALQQTISNPNPVTSGGFGVSAAIDGDYLAVGSLNTVGGATQAGAVYVYLRSGTVWSLQQTIDNPAPVASDTFGIAVALSGSTLCIGVPNKDTGNTNAGVVYVYVRSGTVWSQEQLITAPTPVASGRFGAACAVEGNRLVIGETGADGAVTNGGAVYVYERSGVTWSLQATVLPVEIISNGEFGTRVSLSGDVAVVGYTTSARVVAAIRFVGGLWVSDRVFRPPLIEDSIGFGISVGVDGATIVIGASDDDTGVPNSGSVYVYNYTNGAWVLRKVLKANTPVVGGDFGRAVALNGNRLVVSDTATDVGATDSGSVHIFSKTSDTLTVLHPLPTSPDHKTIVRVQ